MNSTPNENKNFTSDIFGIKEYAPEKPKKKNFLPWHKPRKQYVRQQQWCAQISLMLKEIKLENNTLKYWGLPGDDLLDIRYFHQEICIPNNLHLKFLGFNSSAKAKASSSSDFFISYDEVSKLPMVDPSSDIIGDNICEIAELDSIAWEKSRRMGPYDVINIDLCDGFGKHATTDEFKQNHYNTLQRLLTLQSRRTNPWLLLITTRTGFEHIDPGVYDILKDLYSSNLMTCAPFLEASRSTFSIESNEEILAASKSEKGLSNVFITALCKWIGSLTSNQQPPAKVEVKSVVGYKVRSAAKHQDMISLAVRIDPTFISHLDKLGLARNQDSPINECDMAVNALMQVSNLEDVDKTLKDNPAVKEEMIKTSINLLSEARYDTSSYRQWANKFQ